MTTPLQTAFVAADADSIAEIEGRVAVFIDPEGGMDPLARRVNRLTRGALARLAESDAFRRMKPGEGHALSMPQGLKAEGVLAVKLPKKPSDEEARKAGAAIARFNAAVPLTVLLGARPVPALLSAILMRAYAFEVYRKQEEDRPEPNRTLRLMVGDPAAAEAAAGPVAAVAEGVFFTRDLVSEPANVLTTTEFADRLEALRELGLESRSRSSARASPSTPAASRSSPRRAWRT
jgi:leucyl aminopeptidase